MKHYILLSVKVPPQTEAAQYNTWLDVARHLEPLATTNEEIARLGEGVWLLPRDQGMTFAAECIVLAKKYSLTATVRFLSGDDEPGS
jgi:hypothetical protein